jgi:hypothetical protein
MGVGGTEQERRGEERECAYKSHVQIQNSLFCNLQKVCGRSANLNGGVTTSQNESDGFLDLHDSPRL